MEFIHSNAQKAPKSIVVCQYPFLNKTMTFGTDHPEHFDANTGKIGQWNLKYK